MNRDVFLYANPTGHCFHPELPTKDTWKSCPPTCRERKNAGLKWDDVVDVWMADETGNGAGGGVGPTRSERVVKAWAARLRFADGAVSGVRPAALIDQFNDMVPAAPMVTLAGA
ncbi:hypothetical protein G7Z17_g12222 [Cylindrodendrum hubeiense]|uniref:Uncharacterized protein n=1 Tax=Cylindrodendrum hubeiense TaxID=595255 RepID=A0A9P5GY42_9HYPO|nr:hypothetical protein G7Z17_g12222 [Cylindrodendrum hubeiense]